MSKLFIVDAEGALTPLTSSAYESEHLLQSLLELYPALLGAAGGAEGRLLLVRREAPVPEMAEGAGRWSLDHLFLDRDGVPVLVEVKRATDTRSRREVVAQMLDYAANGVAYWPVAGITDAFRATAEAAGDDPDARLAEFLEEGEPEAFWRAVEANLGAGRVRMVFVADRIARELRRIVEFLNEQMRPAEVLAIELEQFTGTGGVRLLSPRLVGATERAQAAKAIAAPEKPAITVDDWLQTLGGAQGSAALVGAERLWTWAQAQGFSGGPTRTQDALAMAYVRVDGRAVYPCFIRRSTGKVELALQYLRSQPAFAEEADRQALLDRMRALPGQTVTTTRTTGWPAFPASELARTDVWEAFTQVLVEVKARGTAGA